MTFTETLFGGLITVVILFSGARRLGLSTYWCSLLSGAIPTLSYVVFSLTHGVEGDVLAIHLAVYIATAGVLGVFSSTKNKGEEMHWAPKLLMSFFILLVFLMAIFLSVSIYGVPAWVSKTFMPGQTPHGSHTEFSGVSRNGHSPD